MGSVHAAAHIRVTPAGLLAIGGLVAMILIGSALIVLASAEVKGRPRR